MDLDAILATHTREIQELKTALFGEHREAVTDLAASVAATSPAALAEFQQRVDQALEKFEARLAALETLAGAAAGSTTPRHSGQRQHS